MTDVLNPRHRYGQQLTNPINDSLIAICIRGSEIDAKAWFLKGLLSELDKAATHKSIHVVCFVWRGLLTEYTEEFSSIVFLPHEDPEKPDYLAKAKTICVLGYLPTYVVQRPGQRIIQIWVKPTDLQFSHLGLADGFISQLLKTTYLLTDQDASEVALLRDHKLGVSNGVEILNWNGLNSYAHEIIEVIINDNTSGFDRVLTAKDRGRIAICCPIIKDREYWQYVRRLLSLLPYDGYDVTLVTDWQELTPVESVLLNDLPAGLKIVNRVGSFSCSDNEAEEIREQLKDKSQEDFKCWANGIDGQIFKNEVNRLIGTLGFTLVFYCGAFNPYWFMFVREINASMKYRLNIAEVARRGYRGTIRELSSFEVSGEKEVFDEVLVNDRGWCKNQLAFDAASNWSYFSLPYDIENLTPAYIYHETQKPNGSLFALAGIRVSAQEYWGSLCELPTNKGYSVFIDSHVSNVLCTIQSLLARINKEKAQFIIFGQMGLSERAQVMERYSELVTFCNPSSIFGTLALTNYLSHFSVCVVGGDCENESIIAAAEIAGTSILIENHCSLVPLSNETEFVSVQDLSLVSKRKVLGLLQNTRDGYLHGRI